MNAPDDSPHHLDSLTVGKLKVVAKRYGVDVSECKHKKDFVDLLAAAGVTESQVSDALASEEPALEAGHEIADARQEVAAIAGRASEGKVLPAKEDEEVERNIDRALLARPSFFELDSQAEAAWNHMIMADYHDALKVNSELRSKMLDRFASFQVFSCAVSLRAAESIITSLHDAQGKVDPSMRTALAEAKRAFIDGNPRRREQTLEELETLASKAYEAFFEGSTKAEADLRTLLSDYESFGAQTADSRRLLEIAEHARQSFNVSQYAKILEDARQAAARAKDVRKKDIEESFGVVASAVEEAREVGAVLSVGENDIAAAKEAFDNQAFRKAVELLASVERAADQAHLDRMRDNAARQRQVARVSQTIAGLEQTLQEAASYGMDVQDGLIFVSKAKGALVDRDVVTAAKLTRHLKDRSGGIAAELDKERIERGVAKKVEDVKCGKCGKVALYSFPGDVRKCVKCGHSFSMRVEPLQATMEPIEGPVSSSSDGERGNEPDKSDAHQTKRRLLSR